MFTETEGIVLRQINIAGGRRMLVVLTEKFGKISAGTSIPEKGKNKSSLALRPFTKGKYEIYKNRDSYNISAAQVVESFYAIGEDIDKYMAASYVLELSDKLLVEDEPSQGMYKLLCSFLTVLAGRKTDFETPVIAFQIQALLIAGLSLSQNPLMKEQSNDKMSVVTFLETHSIESIENLTLSQDLISWFKAFIRKYLTDNLGIENLKSEGFRI